MTSEELADACVAWCEERKAEDVELYDVRGESVLTDFYLFCSGHSAPQLRAIANHVQQSMKQHSIGLRGIEGAPESEWILLDYFDILVHVFQPSMRNFYRIEETLDPARRRFPPPAAEAARAPADA